MRGTLCRKHLWASLESCHMMTRREIREKVPPDGHAPGNCGGASKKSLVKILRKNLVPRPKKPGKRARSPPRPGPNNPKNIRLVQIVQKEPRPRKPVSRQCRPFPQPLNSVALESFETRSYPVLLGIVEVEVIACCASHRVSRSFAWNTATTTLQTAGQHTPPAALYTHPRKGHQFM